MELDEYIFVGLLGLIFGLNVSSIIFYLIDEKNRKNNEKNKEDEQL